MKYCFKIDANRHSPALTVVFSAVRPGKFIKTSAPAMLVKRLLI